MQAAQTTPSTERSWAVPGTIQAEQYNSGDGQIFPARTTPTGSKVKLQSAAATDSQSNATRRYVGRLQTGQQLNYRLQVQQPGRYEMAIALAAPVAGQQFHMEVGGVNITGPIAVPNTFGWKRWRTLRIPITLAAGSQQLALVVDEAHWQSFNVDSITLAKKALVELADLTTTNNHGIAVVDASGMSSKWRFGQGELQQVNFVGNLGPAVVGGYAQGTYAYLALLAGLTSYEYRALVTPTAASGEAVGIVFNYQNPNNYYRLLTSYAQGYTRLEQRVAGKFTTLAQNARGYLPNRQLELRASVLQGTAVVWINGEKLFAAEAADLNSGSVGVFARDSLRVHELSVTEYSAAPAVYIAEPNDYSVSGERELAVRVLVRNAPANGKVSVTAEGLSCAAIDLPVDAVASFVTATCQASADANLAGQILTLRAELLDGNDAVVDSHQHDTLALQGQQIITIGDSLTWGQGDEYSADGTVTSGWQRARQGYQTNLVQQLNATTTANHLAYNESVRGDQAATIADDRLADYLERHPTADQVVLLVGTNDAQPLTATVSGYGANCTANECANTYKGALYRILQQLSRAKLRTLVVQLPPRFGEMRKPPYPNPSQHHVNTHSIRVFNEIIRGEDPHPLTGYQVGPNLYELFLSKNANRFWLMHDNLHLNGLAVHLLAAHIHNALVGESKLPFFMDALCVRLHKGCVEPNPYKQNLLASGGRLYVDEPTRLVGQVPASLQHGRWITTANAHRELDNQDYLSFSLNESATVYVAYDAAAKLPQWLANWADTGMALTTDSTNAPTLRLLKRDVIVTDGARRLKLPAADASRTGAAVNYVVIATALELKPK